jgi:hypothetical protein
MTIQFWIGLIIGFLWGGLNIYWLIRQYRKQLGIKEGLFEALSKKEL